MLSLALLTLLPLTAVGQCGPNKDRPYKDGACPTKQLADGQGAEGGQAPGGNSAAACAALPCAASLLGDVALTSVAGTGKDGATFAVGENIFGPFEAGFGAQQKNNLKGFGCTDANVESSYVAGGIDTNTAEQMIAAACSVTLPRTVDNTYISLIDECGGHTRDYHFHERLSCLYTEEGKHSTKVGEGLDKKGLYGKWEDFSTSTLPKLDSCGGHFGVTPESNGKKVYHYHVQVKVPFTIGCFGPDKNADGAEMLVSLAKCRSLYPGCTTATNTLTLPTGTVDYKYWCPCYDADGSSVATKELAVFDDVAATVCTDCDSGSSVPVSTDPADEKKSPDSSSSSVGVGAAIVAVATLVGGWSVL